jgi:hypothetical protein
MDGTKIGFSESERVLAKFCEKSFLKLWCYPNPFKSDGHELCDLIAVFGNTVFIFFDRHSKLPIDSEKDPEVLWKRWKNNVVDRQIKTAHGAARYIRAGNSIFLDGKRTTPFPLNIDIKNAVIHKIIISHGAMEACKQASDQNVYGSIAITYCNPEEDSQHEFHISIDRENPVHVFDSHNLSIVLPELDTVTDLNDYLNEKVRAIQKFRFLSYCGEEDLLAHYLLNYDEDARKHIIGPKIKSDTDFDSVLIGEGEWKDFIGTDTYKYTKQKNEISYLWDLLIQKTCQNALDGVLGGNSNLFSGDSAIYEMVKEPRFVRRGIMEIISNAIQNFPDKIETLARQVTFIPSSQENVAYVYLQLYGITSILESHDYRDKRRTLLEIACGAAKNKYPNLIKVIGIAMDAPKHAGQHNSEDFILMPCENWPQETKDYYQEINNQFNFFGSTSMKEFRDTLYQFVQPPETQN